MNADEHQKQQEEEQLWIEHLKSKRELEQLLDDMNIRHVKLRKRPNE